MLRTVIGVVVGAGVGLGAVYGWQLLGHEIFPLLSHMEPTDPSKRVVLVNAAPFSAQAFVVAGYPLGVVPGGLLGNWISDARWPSTFVAVAIAAAFFATLTVTPHPFWMQAAGILLPLLAGLVISARVGTRTLVEP